MLIKAYHFSVEHCKSTSTTTKSSLVNLNVKIIPGVRMLLKHFGKSMVTEESSVVRNACRQMSSSLETRLSGVKCGIATALTVKSPCREFSYKHINR